MSAKKRASAPKDQPAVGSKSQLLLALKDQVIQLQEQLQAEKEEREKISGWLANTLKPNLQSKFSEYREELDSHSSQIDRIRQFLKDNREPGGSSRSDTVSREEFEELQKNLATEREARLQLSLWLKQNLGKNMELLDQRIASLSNSSPGLPPSSPAHSSVLPESVPEWLRMIGYERYINEFQRAKCNDVRKLVRLTDDHLVKLGIALKRHRVDILHEVSGLKQKLEDKGSAPSTPVRATAKSDVSVTVDPFAEDDIRSKAEETVAEKNRIIEAEKQKIQEQFENEKQKWMEQERERIRLEIEQQEREKIKEEEKKMERRLAKERRALEEKQRELERKEAETKKQQQQEEKKRTKLYERQQKEEKERKEREERERREQEKREREERERREFEAWKQQKEREQKTEPVEPEVETPKKIEKRSSNSFKKEEKVKEVEETSEAVPVKKKATTSSKTLSSTENESGKSFSQLIEDVRDDNCPTNWVAFYFDKASNSVKLTNFGKDGHEDLLDHLEDDKVQYALLRVVDPKRRVKFIYIHWVGKKAHAFLKARSGTKKAEVLDLMGQFHIEMPAETKEDISKQAILTKLKAAVNF